MTILAPDREAAPRCGDRSGLQHDRRATPAAGARDSTRSIWVIPPYLGEFGWELMSWQARVRWTLRRSGERTVFLFAPADRRALYDDPRVILIPTRLDRVPGSASDDRRLDHNGQPLGPTDLKRTAMNLMRAAWAPWREAAAATTAGQTPIATAEDLRRMDRALNVADPRRIDACDKAAFLYPAYNGRPIPTTPRFQCFKSLAPIKTRAAAVDESAGGRGDIDILLVRRGRAMAVERNLPEDWWTALARRLTERNLRVATAPGTLDQAIDALSRARLAVGGSTGGLHLASLCGCPHYVWGPADDARWTAWEMSNRQRYETVWNPLGTPVAYAALGWRPDLDDVTDGVIDALKRLGRGARVNETKAWRLRWRIRRAAMPIWLGQSRPRAPWRVRQWLAETC
jgi:hypothetical protein